MGFVGRYEVPPGGERGSEADLERRSHLAHIRPTDRCFYCGEPLTCERLVYWEGHEAQQIWLHAGCAHKLGTRLVKDGLLAEGSPSE